MFWTVKDQGSVLEAEVIYNDRGSSKGFGFITMASRGDAVNALSRLDRIVVDGRLIQVVPVGTRELVQAEVKGTRALHEAIEGGNPRTAQVLLSYGADPLLHDYSGNMPVDLATERTMQLYFINILADLQGKVPTRAKSESTFSTSVLSRWNVSHSPEFHLPPEHLFVKQQKINSRQKREEEIITFEAFETPEAMTPPFFQLKETEGDWLLYTDLKEFSRKHCNNKHDIRSKGNLLEMKKAEFLRSSHCKQLDRAGLEVRYQEKEDEESVTLVKVDKYIRKILSLDVTKMPSA